MKTLTLVRHAKSSWKQAGLSDFERPLNRRGERDAPAMGRHLASIGLVPDVIVSSPAVRALATARALADALGRAPVLVEEPAVYAADAAELLHVVRAIGTEVEHAFLVGHNPGMAELLDALTGATPEKFVTCGVAVVELDAASWRRTAPGVGKLVRFMAPKSIPDG